MSAIFPTALPWQVMHDHSTYGRTTIIGNVDGEIIDGTTHHTYDFVATTLDDTDDSQSRSIAVANAAFIVRACNSHAALVGAIDRYLAARDALDAAPTHNSRAVDAAMAEHEVALGKLRAVSERARNAVIGGCDE